MQRKVNFEGWRLLVVRAADKAGFWYAENFKGFGEGEPSALPPFPTAAIRMDQNLRFNLGFPTQTRF